MHYVNQREYYYPYTCKLCISNVLSPVIRINIEPRPQKLAKVATPTDLLKYGSPRISTANYNDYGEVMQTKWFK